MLVPRRVLTPFLIKFHTPLKFNSSPLKIDGWTMNFLLGPGQFSGLMLNFQGVSLFFWFREASHFLQLISCQTQLIMVFCRCMGDAFGAELQRELQQLAVHSFLGCWFWVLVIHLPGFQLVHQEKDESEGSQADH